MCHYVVIGVYEKSEHNGAVLDNHEVVFGLRRTGRHGEILYHVKVVLGKTNERHEPKRLLLFLCTLTNTFTFKTLFAMNTLCSMLKNAIFASNALKNSTTNITQGKPNNTRKNVPLQKRKTQKIEKI